MVINVLTVDTISNATDALLPTLTVVAYCFKIINFKVNADKMQMTFKDLMKFQFQNDNEIRQTNKKLQTLYKVVMCLLAIAHLSIVFTFIGALFANDPPKLPLPSWYPIDWQHVSLYYWIAYTYQMFGAFICININVTMDAFLVLVMSILCKHLEILGERLTSITLKSNSKRGKAKMNGELIGCIKVHQNLIR